MNKAILMGRLTRDPEMRTTPNQVNVCTFTIAVDRRFKSANGERQADFIPVVAWRQQADFVGRYFRKGSRIVVVGSIQTRNWEDQEGKKRTTTEVIADEIYFGDSKKGDSYAGGDTHESAPSATKSSDNGNDGFFPAPDDDTSLPFDL
ncbi:MAG: single-strand DNA-binding protein [Clostridiales bacterium]|jgi:single-strand DNA-binding protein|nr:single-stranded DNA-binding protein [Eubacteriales bacterium]MDD3197454.1 single-stranded DNA-binding protein [Eubacteriales bacterium]MDD3503601.1 single-stranded DNA-binding protein [Eubacteriales bacterium]MDD4682557.1 single-stranded DNA-binding protein [Eubacteriales bacterium]MDN5314726.1 single-strand DNA-binding protein [Clostridiales bacterium]